jgi:hypothetical protein
MKPEWFCLLFKAADIVFDIPIGSSFWPVEMYEPLIIGIAFPFIRHPPWQLRGTPKVARDGDHLLVPFECDLCIFRKLKSRNPIPGDQEDLLMLACGRRANLDAFWSRAKSTALTNCDKVAFGIKLLATMGLLGPYKADGPLPEEDHFGYEVAFEMLLHSQRNGSYSELYTQFDTIRKLRSAFSNHCLVSTKANIISMALGDQKGRYLHFATDPCSSFCFY